MWKCEKINKHLLYHGGDRPMWCIADAETFDDSNEWSWTGATLDVEDKNQVPDFENADGPWAVRWPDDMTVRKCPLPTKLKGYHPTFTDPEFPPEAEKCIGEPTQEGFPKEEVHFVRAPRLVSALGPPRLFSDIEPGDVMQGALGDCWLLAAFSALAEFPGYLQREVLREQELSTNGSYTVMLYDMEVKERVEIKVDDFIPCHKRDWWDASPKPLFAQPKGNELYILILEKVLHSRGNPYRGRHVHIFPARTSF